MTMRAGKLRHRVTLQRRVVTRHPNSAEMYEEWQNLDSVWAEVVPLSGREFTQSMQPQADITHTVVIRYYDGLTPRDRVRFGSRVLEIDSVVNRDERNEMLTLQCIERSA